MNHLSPKHSAKLDSMEFFDDISTWIDDTVSSLELSDPIVIGIAFVAVFLVVLVAFNLVRFLFGRNGEAAERRRWRREKTVYDEPIAERGFGRFDQWFDRLILESGMTDSPIAGMLLLFTAGVLVGGALFVFYDNPLIGIAGFIGAMLLMLLVLVIVRARRMRRIREDMPHVAEILARGVKAGESVDQAIELVGAEARGPLGREFARCSRQLNMGRSLTSVMRSFANRIRILETRIMASTLIVHRQSGGNLVRALERMARVIRDRLNFYRQLRASTGAGRTSAIIIATLTPILFLVLILWRPDHIQVLWQDQLGRVLLVAAVILEIVGLIWIWRLLKTD